MFDDGALITRERALQVIGSDKLNLLRDVQRQAWSEWETVRATKEGATFSTSARARIVYDATVRRAREAFPQSMCTSHHGLLVLDFGELLVRFKKVNDHFVPRGIPTGQAAAFEEQAQVGSPQLSLWPPKPILIVGYVVDRLGIEIQRQALILRRGGLMWWHDLADVSGEAGEPAALPVVPRPALTPQAAIVRSARREPEEIEEAR